MTATRTAPYETRPASPVLGAEIVGVDLTGAVDDATAEALREDFWKHKVLVFRGQHLTPDAHVKAVQIFDKPFDHPRWLHRYEDNRLVYVFNLEKGGAAAQWHVGGTWRNPPFNIESLTYHRWCRRSAVTRCGPICRRRTTACPSRSSGYWSRSTPCTAITRGTVPTIGRR